MLVVLFTLIFIVRRRCRLTHNLPYRTFRQTRDTTTSQHNRTNHPTQDFPNRSQHSSNATHTAIKDNTEPSIREAAYQDTPKQTRQCRKQRDSPLSPIKPSNTECLTPDKNNHDLPCYHDAIDPQEPEVAMDAFENVEFVIQSAVVDLVEDLHPDERVEHDRVEFRTSVSAVS
jgi:hypothetical protein